MTGKRKIYLSCGIILSSIIVSSITTFAVIETTVKKEVKILTSATKPLVNQDVTLEAKTIAIRVSTKLVYEWFVNDQKIANANEKVIVVSSQIAEPVTYKVVATDEKTQQKYTSEIVIQYK